MGTLSIGHWLVVLAVILIVFGAGKIPSLMGDLAKGIKSFKANMKDDGAVAVPAKEIGSDRPAA